MRPLHVVHTPVSRRVKPVPVRWALLVGVAIGLIILVVLNVLAADGIGAGDF